MCVYACCLALAQTVGSRVRENILGHDCPSVINSKPVISLASRELDLSTLVDVAHTTLTVSPVLERRALFATFYMGTFHVPTSTVVDHRGPGVVHACACPVPLDESLFFFCGK